MKRMMIGYTAKPGRADENAGLIAAVFAELAAKAPTGLRYLVMRTGNNQFVHVVEQDDDAPSLSEFEAFQAFQKDANERLENKPEASEVTIIGAYGSMNGRR